MDSPSLMGFDYNRKFGVEIELNSLDERDFKARPLRANELPKGIEYIAKLISENNEREVSVAMWHHTHNNTCWVLKPDRSCGMEICSPVLSGIEGIEEICKIIDVLAADPVVISDNRCSFHVHVNVEDLSQRQLACVLAYWIKCEPVFLDSVPLHRKLNNYCQMIGVTDVVEHDTPIDIDFLTKALGKHKYYTLNTYHFERKRRSTIEFRICEAAACLDSQLARNWMRLVIHFVERAKNYKLPAPYEKDNPWSSYLWLDPEDVFTFLGFDGKYSLCDDMEETKKWFLTRLHTNVSDLKKRGIWSAEVRGRSRQQIENLRSQS